MMLDANGNRSIFDDQSINRETAMVAYSFQRMFVNPIRAGLGISGRLAQFPKDPEPKRQTIRAIGKRLHARPGNGLEFYCGMRTKDCFLIGKARCISTAGIRIQVGREIISVDDYPVIRDGDLDPFARADGFPDWSAMREFWTIHHGIGTFEGAIIKWEPL